MTVLCRTSFGVSTLHVDALFTPTPGATLTGSRTPIETLDVTPASSAVSLDASATVSIGRSTTYTATVAGQAGPLVPTGSVEFLDRGQPIGSCPAERLIAAGATCAVTYPATGAHAISPRYLGDANFTSATSAGRPVMVLAAPPFLGLITAAMQWSFYYSPRYTQVRALVVNGAGGASVRVTCKGKGCPFGTQLHVVKSMRRCAAGATSGCQNRGQVNLAPPFRHRRLPVGARMTVTIARPGRIGKIYTFTVRASRGPRVLIDCLQPGKALPRTGR